MKEEESKRKRERERKEEERKKVEEGVKRDPSGSRGEDKARIDGVSGTCKHNAGRKGQRTEEEHDQNPVARSNRSTRLMVS